MATAAESLTAAGWRYDPTRNGYVRGDTTWNAATQSWNTPNSVGGTIFVPASSLTGLSPSAGVSGMAAAASGGGSSPALPAMRAPTAVVPSTVGVSGTVAARPVEAALSSWQAPDAAGIGDVQASQVDPFLVDDPAVLQQLDQQAQEELALGGALSAEEIRGAEQQARSAFGARGMLMGKPAVAAEILNRDQYSRQRKDQRRAFAQGIAAMLGERARFNAGMGQQAALANQDARLRAGMANQGTRLNVWQIGAQGGLQQSLANAAARNQVGLANESNRLSAGQFNIDAALRAAMANQSAGLQAGGINTNAGLDFARLGIEGMLGAFNAQTGRINALNGPLMAANQFNAAQQQALIAGADQRAAANDYARGVSGYVPAYRALGSYGTPSASYRPLGY